MTQDEEWLLKEKYHGEKSEGFFADCERLQNGEPLAYIIGHVPFLGTTITLDSHPLIPRTETEYWTERAVAELHTLGTERPLRVLDLCAGSGCIGVAVLHHLKNARVDFAEIDARHFPTILENIRINGIDPARAHIIESNLLTGVRGTYDAILSNPPYIDPALDRTTESVRAYEPQSALYGGEYGLFFIREIIRKAPEHLAPHGILYLEHEPEQVDVIRSSATDAGLSATAFPDQFGVLRFTRMTRTNRDSVPQ